jgi:hypothetical protein
MSLLSSFTIAFLLYYSYIPTYGHLTKKFGNVTILVGWVNEPALVGDLNNVLIEIQKGTGKGISPVLNAFSNLSASVKYGTLTKNLDLLPSETTDGSYEGMLIPARVGTYSVVLKGDLGQKINGEIQLDAVEGKQGISFPDTSPADASANNALVSNVEGTLSQLSNDLQDAQENIGQLGKNLQIVQNSISSINQSVDRTYMISVTAIGVGLAGIIIAGFSLSRKTEI